MKKFFKPAFWLSLFMGILIIGVSSLGVFLAQKKISTVGETSINQKDYKKYFKEKIINRQISGHYDLKLSDKKNNILWLLTDWNESTSRLLSFDKEKVNTNILSFTHNSIQSFAQFSNQRLYINVKYELVSSQSLILDIRWANLNAVQNKETTNLFWEMTKINLS